ncbi:MAG: hypothetical protein PF551_05590 [Candidatus Marinimicrobia bacterium]|jgi:hypothetical protein|nr:hypothetical protein [Candidatus Neomarinimicrobiota bacterium]
MKLIRIGILVFLCLSMNSLLFGDSDTTKQTKKPITADISSYTNYLGVSISNISSYGISYTSRISKKVDLKFVSLFYYYRNDSSDETDRITNIGIEYHHILYMTKLSKMFFLVGTGYSYSSVVYDEKNSFSLGCGLGIDFLVSDHFFWELGLAYNFRKGKNANTFAPGVIISGSYAF